MHATTARFGSVMTAMVTPFDRHGDLDTGAAGALAEWLVANGSDGLVLAGTTGESPVLSETEEDALATSVRSAVTVPVVLGTGSNDTAYAVRASKRAGDLGMDGVLVVSPYYNRPHQAGLESYFRSVAAATDLPVIVYDIPLRTGRKIDTATIVRLARDVENIVALKDAAGHPGETARVIRDTPDGFEVYSGDDPLTLSLLAVGAVGAISVASHWAGRQISEMIDAHRKGDVHTAASINANLIDSYDFESNEGAPNPMPTKAMLRAMGHDVGGCRPPMTPDPDGLEDRARRVLAGLA